MADIDFNENDIMEKIEEIDGYRSEIVSSLRSKNVDLDDADGLSSIAFKLGQGDDYIIKANDQQFGAVKNLNLSVDNTTVWVVDSHGNLVTIVGDDAKSFSINAENLATQFTQVLININTLNQTTTGLNNNITGLSQNIVGITGNVNGLTADVSKAKSDIISLTTNYTGLNGRCATLENTANNEIPDKIAAICTYLGVDLVLDETTLKYKCVAKTTTTEQE